MYVLSFNNGLARCELICSARQKSNVEKKNHTQKSNHTWSQNRSPSRSQSQSQCEVAATLSVVLAATLCTKFYEKSCLPFGDFGVELFYFCKFVCVCEFFFFLALWPTYQWQISKIVSVCHCQCLSIWLVDTSAPFSRSFRHKRFLDRVWAHFFCLFLCLLAAYFPGGIWDFMNESQSQSPSPSPMRYIPR